MNLPFTAERLTTRNLRRDFPEWHRGRPRYMLWALDVDIAALRPRLHAAQQQLSGRLLEGYCRQPHITLSLCGFPSRSPRYADDFDRALLAAQIAALDRARVAPFDIEIGGLASFNSAPYLTVADAGGNIARLREQLAFGAIDERKESYTAHVTVGLYSDAWPTREIQTQLDAFASDAPLRLRISHLQLVSYVAATIGGRLTRMAAYDLSSGRLRRNRVFPFSGIAARISDSATTAG